MPLLLLVSEASLTIGIFFPNVSRLELEKGTILLLPEIRLNKKSLQKTKEKQSPDGTRKDINTPPPLAATDKEGERITFISLFMQFWGL